jgi:CheY-like chemotaxis protein
MPLRILIVEDDIDLCEILRMSFEHMGHKVSVAFSGHEGAEFLKKNKPDVLITDLKMPNGDGVQLLQSLRAQNILVPKIAVMSGYADFSQQELAALGVQAVVQKPCLPSDILKKLGLEDA